MREIKRGALNAIGAAIVAVVIYYAAQALMPQGERQAATAGSIMGVC